MKIILVSANTFTEPYPVYPLGLDYVAGSLKPNHDVAIIDMNTLAGTDELTGKIAAASPDLVGVALRNIDNTDAADSRGFIRHYQQVVAAIRKGSGSPLVMGGSGFTLFPNELMAELDADYGVVGEGERMRLLADALQEGHEPPIPGIVTRSGNGHVPPPWTDTIRRDVDLSTEHAGYYLKRGGMMSLQSKRGCSYRCIYCTYPHIEGNSLRLFPPDEVAETALALEKSGARYLFVTDAVFNCHADHCAAVAEAFIRKKVRIPWGAYFAPLHPTKDFYPLLKRAGLTHVEFGTESLSDRMLATYGKPFRAGDVLRANEAAVQAGLHAAHFLLLGGPGEDAGTINETLAKAEQLRHAVLFFFCGIRIYPHTKLHALALSEGQIGAGDNLLSPVFYRSGMNNDGIVQMVKERAGARTDWVFGAGGEKITKILRRMYRKGFTGPLWEYLIR